MFADSLLASRVRSFEPPPQWGAMREAKKKEAVTGESVIHFELGDFQGDLLPEPAIVDAICRALRADRVRYAPGPGLPELREAIAAEVSKRGRDTDPDEVLVTFGAKHALMQSILATVDHGDGVILPDPGYPPDAFWVNYAGGRVATVPMMAPEYQIDVDALARLAAEPHNKILILNTPQRPNGKIVGHLPEIAEICMRHGLSVISDEIFSHLVYPPASHQSIAAVPGMAERTILIDTFSKTYVMTGLRIGYLVAPRELVAKLDIFQQNSVTNVAEAIQCGALAALTGDQGHVADRVARLQAQRDQVVAALNAMPGVSCNVPDGSFYVFPDISATGRTAAELANCLLQEYLVAVVPGTAFGVHGEGHVRLTYAVPPDVLTKGLSRLERAFTDLAAGVTRMSA